MPVRITFVITNLDRGGCPLLLAALAPGLAAKGFDVDVVSISPAGVVAPMLRDKHISVASLMARNPLDLRVVPRFAAHLRRRKPDIVASLLIHANLLSVLARPLAGVKTLCVHSIHTQQERPRWHWYLQGILCSFADGFVAPAQAVIQKLQAYGPIPQPTVIRNGIDVARFRDAVPMNPAHLPWPSDAVVVGYVGRFDPVKRLPLLIHAIARLVEREGPSPVHLALVGYGEQELDLRTLAATLGVQARVHFLGASAEPERWFKTFTLFCSPSAAEAFPLTYAEAACAGLPIIACHTPAIREAIANACWLPEVCDASDIASAILLVANHLSQYRMPSEALGTFAQQQMVESYAAMFDRIAHS